MRHRKIVIGGLAPLTASPAPGGTLPAAPSANRYGY